MTTLLAVLTALALAIAACGSDDTETEDGASSDSAPTSEADGSETTTSEAASGAGNTESDAAEPSSDQADDDGDESAAAPDDSTTTTAPIEGDGAAPPAGTGVLNIDGTDYPFAVTSCDLEPTVQQQTGAVVLFSMRGVTAAEDREVQVTAARIELNGVFNDSYGYTYVDDPSDFQTAVIVGSGGSEGELLLIDGPTYSAGPVAFQRVEGVSVVEDVDPGPGSIRFTC